MDFFPTGFSAGAYLFGLLTEIDFVIPHKGLTEHDVDILAFRMKRSTRHINV